MRLAKSGYYGGDPDKVIQAPVDTVMNIVRYEAFDHDLNDAFRAMHEEARNEGR